MSLHRLIAAFALSLVAGSVSAQQLPDPIFTVSSAGGVSANTCAANQAATGIAANGTLTCAAIGTTLGTQTANTLFAGPTTGGAATPTFRAMVADDLGTTLTPQMARLGLGVAAGSTAKLTLLGGGIIAPSADSTAAIIFTKTDAATAVLTLDTTNSKLILPANGTIASTSGNLNLGSSNLTISTSGAMNSATNFAAGFGFGVSAAGNGGDSHWVSSAILGWNNSTSQVTTSAFGTFDTGFARNAAGIVEVNNGTAGTFRDLVLRTYITNGTTAVGVANVGANSCGTSAASIAGNENVGAFTVGATSGTQCRIAFTTTAPNRRHCTFNDETTTIAIRSTYVDTTHTDALGAFVAGDVVSYHCMSR
jgi:hypothetical protein